MHSLLETESGKMEALIILVLSIALILLLLVALNHFITLPSLNPPTAELQGLFDAIEDLVLPMGSFAHDFLHSLLEFKAGNMEAPVLSVLSVSLPSPRSPIPPKTETVDNSIRCEDLAKWMRLSPDGTGAADQPCSFGACLVFTQCKLV